MTNDNVVSINDEKLAIDGATQDEREEMCPATAALLEENAKGFDLLLSDFRRDCKPANAAEDSLVQMMVGHFWAVLRKTRLETGLVESHMERALEHTQIRLFAELNDISDPGVNFEFDTRRLGIGFDMDCARNKSQLAITRVAAASDTGFLKAYSMLLKVQALRQAASPRKRDRAA
jgi:hypothetical protein